MTMTIEHKATDGFRGNRKPLCGASPTRWAADAIPCQECERLHIEKSLAGGYKKATEAEIDQAMAKAGFEAAGNDGGLWNKLNPLDRDAF